MNSRILSLAAAGLLLSAGTVQADEWTANFAASNNYIWRGLTQSINEAAISGGIDYAADSGFYHWNLGFKRELCGRRCLLLRARHVWRIRW